MKKDAIRSGRWYKNAGYGKVHRFVLAIGLDHRPEWMGRPDRPPPETEPGVWWCDNRRRTGKLFLSSFAKWAGSEVVR